MDLTGKKIGYWPYSASCNSAGDRRRFIFFANEKKIDYEVASLDGVYDILYLTIGCNIDEWLTYKKKHPAVKIIFEIVDSYILEGINLVTAFRGTVRYFKGREKKYYLDYRRAIIKMVKGADAIVCSTPIQRDHILQYNKNVHISLDYFLNDITETKSNLQSTDKLKLVWEGQAYTVHNLLHYNSVFKHFGANIELHIITDPEIKYPLSFFNKKTSDLLSSIPCEYHLYDWKKDTFSSIISSMDLAIIPMNKHKYGTLTTNKPENKLLLLWQIGIPVLTSDSPAYKRVMDTAGLSMYCSSKQDWILKIEEFMKFKEAEKAEILKKAGIYLDNYHSKEIILQKWSRIFESL